MALRDDSESGKPAGEGAATVPAARVRRVSVTEDGRLKSGRLAGLSMGGAIWVLAWPIMTESLLNAMVGVTDTYLAARLGTAETDAIGGASYITWFMGLIIMALGVGATALVSRSVGAGKMAVANAALGQTVMLGAIAGVAVGLVAMAIAPAAAWVLNMNERATDAFTSYMQIVAAGAPATTLLFAGIACARGAGDSVRPLWAMAAVNLVNIVSSWVLSGVDLSVASGDGGTVTLVENPFGFDMGVRGIAGGTLLAHVVGAGIILLMARNGVWGIRLTARRMKPHWHTVRRLVKLGAANFLETSGMWVGNFVVLLMVGSLASEAMLGSHVIGIRVESLSFLPGFAMGAAAATLAGQYVGAGAPELARRAVFRCGVVAACVMGLMGAVFVLFPAWVVGLLTTEPAHLETAPSLVRICGFVQVPFAIMIVTRSAMRGVGDVRTIAALTWICTYAVRLPLAYACSGVDLLVRNPKDGSVWLLIENPVNVDWGLTGLWFALCAEQVVRCAVFLIRYLRGRWLDAEV